MFFSKLAVISNIKSQFIKAGIKIKIISLLRKVRENAVNKGPFLEYIFVEYILIYWDG
jgi:hypothetical protein